MSFVHLQVHSEFSILQASARLDDILAAAAADNAPAVALTDNGNMFGTLEFQERGKDFNKKRKEAGLPPLKTIIGCHIYVDAQGASPRDLDSFERLTLLVENKEGYYNLLRIVSYRYEDSSRWSEVPSVPLDVVEAHKVGLFAIAGDFFSRYGVNAAAGREKPARAYIEALDKIFDHDHFYLSLCDNGIEAQRTVNLFTISLAKELGRELVAVNDVHYSRREDSLAHKALRCISLVEKLKEFDDKRFPTDQFHFRTEMEMQELFGNVPNALENTVKIAERCNFSVRTGIGDDFWPKYKIPEGFADADDYLRHLCEERVSKRYDEVTDQVKKQMEYELETIKKMNVAGYLLIVWDFINWSREHGIPVGPGRGSAAGSIVTYIIGITDIDPLKFGLLFERFLNPERVSMPDIDTDIADRDRSRVIDYVTGKYGAECVGQIVTYGMLKSKAVIKDVGRVLGVSIQDVNSIIRLFPQRVLNFSLRDAWTGKDKKNRPIAPDYDPAPLQALVNGRKSFQELWGIAVKLEDLPRQTGVHACAVVITPTPMWNLAPLYRATPSDTPVVMYDKHYAETIGLLKMDFLGLINLSIIQDTVSLVKQTRGIELDMSRISLDDKETYELLGRGMTTAVFQFESPGMQKYLRELKPSRIGDLIAMNALYRPGPIDQIPHFIARKIGKEPIDCYHKDLEPVLSETYGVIVYQEQVMKLAQILGGYTLGGADNIRRIMAKKMPEKMAKLEPEFFEKCLANGYEKSMIKKVWDAVLPFCGYAFNKSHAAAYAYVAYQTAYLKTHFSAEYMAASMTAKMSKTEDIVTVVQECKRMGIVVLAPDINTSLGIFSANSKGQIIYGLAGIRNVGLPIIEDVVAERELHGPYKDLFELCKRVGDYQATFSEKHAPLNRKTLESLVMAGALDKLSPTGPNRPTLMASVEKALDVAARYRKEQDAGQVSLFDMGGESSVRMDESLEDAQPWSLVELLNKEREVLGHYLSAHPLDECRPELRGFTTTSLAESELSEIPVKSIVCVGGIVTKLRSLQSKKDETKTFGAGTIQDFHGEISVFFSGDVWEQSRDRIAIDDRVLIKGKLENQRDSTELQIRVEKAYTMDEVRTKLVNFIHISLSSMGLVEERLKSISDRLEMYQALPGEHSAEIVFHIETLSGYEHVLCAHSFKVAYTPELLEWLQKEFDSANVWVSAKIKG